MQKWHGWCKRKYKNIVTAKKNWIKMIGFRRDKQSGRSIFWTFIYLRVYIYIQLRNVTFTWIVVKRRIEMGMALRNWGDTAANVAYTNGVLSPVALREMQAKRGLGWTAGERHSDQMIRTNDRWRSQKPKWVKIFPDHAHRTKGDRQQKKWLLSR